MKKFLALLLTLVMALSLAACGGSDEESTDSPAEDPAANEESSGSAADVKIGLICVHDINSGYDAAHIEGLTAACEGLGIDANSQVIFRYNIAEDENCYDAAVDLAEEGCNIIFSDSYGHQSYMLDAAEDYPDVTFVSCTGDMAATSGLDNYKNLFPYTYESRYVSGVVAGMKLKELMDAGTVTDPKVGYVGAYPYAEVVCGYTAFLLGIQTQVPEAYMEVQYTNSWYDPVAEGEAANALMARGCVIIGQHADSTGAPSAVQAQKDAGSVVYSVGYNIDMLEVAPTAALTSSQNNWSVLYRDTLEKFIAGEEVPVDYAVGISEDAVMISKLGPECAEGTQEAVDAAWSSIKDGSLKVFDTSKFTCQPAADGSYQVDADGHVTSAFGLDSDGDFVNDTGEAIVVCKDASFSKEDNEHYYLIRYTSFCEQVEVDGVLRDKYVRQTRREIDEGTVREVYEDGFPEPKSKPFTYVDDEYAERAIRCSRTYYEYAKDICENYRMDLRRYKLIRERKQYIGVSNREAYQAMCEDLAFAQQSLKTVLNDYANLFRKRFSEGLSIRKAADAMQQNRGVIERRQAALYRAFAQLLQQRDEADGVYRLMQKTEYNQRDIEDLLE